MPLLCSPNKCESKSWQKVYLMNQFDKTFSFVKVNNRKRAKSPGGKCSGGGKPRHYITHHAVSCGRLLSSSSPGGGKPRHYISHEAVSAGRLLTSSAFTLLMCCLLVVFSGCASLFSGVTSGASQPTPVIKLNPTLTPSPTPAPLTNSELAQKIVRGMSLDQKLGQMVIVEFYGATLNSDLIQMIQGNRVSGVLIENKNGNAQTRAQLTTLNTGMQGQAHIPLFITTDFEGGLVNELRQITGERPSEATIGATGNPQVAYTA